MLIISMDFTIAIITTSGSSPTSASGSPQSDGSLVLWAVTGGILVLISVVIAVAVIVVIMYAKHRRNLDGERTYDLPANYQKPIAPPVETIPPRMEFEMNIAYEQVKSIDMSANSAYTVIPRS